MLNFICRDLTDPEGLRAQLERGCERAGLSDVFAYAYKQIVDLFGDKHEYCLVLAHEGRYASVSITVEGALASLAPEACGYLLPQEAHQARFQTGNIYLPGSEPANHLFMGQACLDLLTNHGGLFPHHHREARRLAQRLREFETPETRLLAARIFEGLDDLPACLSALGGRDLAPNLWDALQMETRLRPAVYAWMVRAGAANARDEREFSLPLTQFMLRFMNREQLTATIRLGYLGDAFACLYRYLVGRTQPWIVQRSVWVAKRTLTSLLGESEFERWTQIESEEQAQALLNQLEQRCQELCPYLYQEPTGDWPGPEVLEALDQRR